MSKLYPIGIQNFEKIRKEGYVYVDKTAMIYQLVKPGNRTLLLPQPSPPLWQKLVDFHPRSLLSREKGTLYRTGNGETGKRLDYLSHPAFRFKHRKLQHPPKPGTEVRTCPIRLGTALWK